MPGRTSRPVSDPASWAHWAAVAPSGTRAGCVGVRTAPSAQPESAAATVAPAALVAVASRNARRSIELVPTVGM